MIKQQPKTLSAKIADAYLVWKQAENGLLEPFDASLRSDATTAQKRKATYAWRRLANLIAQSSRSENIVLAELIATSESIFG